jgi:opacity protein-like surface antigen
MKKNNIICLFVLLSVALLSAKADAHTIKEGTITIGISGFNLNRDFDAGNNSREYDIDLDGGYFLMDNIEIGAGMSYDHYYDALQTNTSWSLSPYVRYHEPLNVNSNVYGGVGVFFTGYDNDYSSSNKTTEDSSGITFRMGWEYFFNDNVSLNVGFSYSRAEWSNTGQSISSEKENRFYWPQIGLRVFL